MPRRQRMARWIEILEDLVPIPGTRLSFGLDFLLGLLPVVGDFAGLVCGLPLVAVALRRRLPLRVIVIMLANVLVDAVFGSVPILGNVFDLLWKAHRKNLRLLEEPAAVGEIVREAGWKATALVFVVVLLAMVLLYLLGFTLWAAWKLQDWLLWTL